MQPFDFVESILTMVLCSKYHVGTESKKWKKVQKKISTNVRKKNKNKKFDFSFDFSKLYFI